MRISPLIKALRVYMVQATHIMQKLVISDEVHVYVVEMMISVVSLTYWKCIAHLKYE